MGKAGATAQREYSISFGFGIDRESQQAHKARQVADVIFLLFRWLMAIAHRAARVLTTDGTAANGDASVRGAGSAAARISAAIGDRPRLEHWSPGQEQPLSLSVRWMTYCLERWRIMPRRLLPAFAGTAGRAMSQSASRAAAEFLRDDHSMSCAERMPDCNVPAFGASGHSTGFSIFARASDR
jgi:hypothetical protein